MIDRSGTFPFLTCTIVGRETFQSLCMCVWGETEGQETRDLDGGETHTGSHIGHSWWLLDWDPSRCALGGRSLKGLLLWKMLLGSVSDPLCLAVPLQSLVFGGSGQS